MGMHYFSGRAKGGGKEDIRRQTQRTIALYEDVLERAREVAHQAEERVHRLIDHDGHDSAQGSDSDD